MDGATAFFEPFSVNLTTGALTSLGRVTTSITPTRVTAGRANGVFLISDTVSVLCYRYDSRLGTGPTLESNFSVANLFSMAVTSDDLTLVYSKSGSGSLFWRTLDKCTLGNEQSVSLPGSTGDISFVLPDTPNLIFALDGGRSALWKVQRNLTTGALSGVSTVAASLCWASLPSFAVTPDGAYGYYCDGGGTDLGVINLSTLAINTVSVGVSVDIIIPTENRKGTLLTQGDAHRGFTVNSSGAPSLSGSATYSIPDLRYGVV